MGVLGFRKLGAHIVLAIWWIPGFLLFQQTRGGPFLHSYRHWLAPLLQGSAEFSLISRSFAFPVVGIADHAGVGPWLYVFSWSFVLLGPLVMMAIVTGKTDPAAVDRVLLYGLFPYLGVLVLGLLILALGLWLPFSLL